MAKPFLFDRANPPRSVSVLGHRLKIKTVNYLEDESVELLGAFNAENKTIFLVRGPNWRSVLLHEIIHAILHFSGTGDGLSMSKEESIVLALEHGLVPILNIMEG